MPYNIPEIGGKTGCATQAQAAEMDRLAAEYEAEQAEQRAEELRAAEARRETEKQKQLKQQREKADARNDSLDRKAKQQVKRLAPATGPRDQESPEAIMRRLRENSVLDRLHGTRTQTAAPSPNQKLPASSEQLTTANAPNAGAAIVNTAPSNIPAGIPTRQTPGPRFVLPPDRETARLPTSPSGRQGHGFAPPQTGGCTIIAGQTICTGTPETSWIQDFAISGNTSPEKLPAGARAEYEARLRSQEAKRYSQEAERRDAEILEQCGSFGCDKESQALLSAEGKRKLAIIDAQRAQGERLSSGREASKPPGAKGGKTESGNKEHWSCWGILGRINADCRVQDYAKDHLTIGGGFDDD